MGFNSGFKGLNEQTLEILKFEFHWTAFRNKRKTSRNKRTEISQSL